MTSWDIRPQGVDSTLNKTKTAISRIEGQSKSLAKNVQTAAKSAGTMPSSAGESRTMGPVGLALAEFAKAKQLDLLFVGMRVAKSVLGAQEAAVAYLKGDQEMAINTQRSASTSLPMSKVQLEADRAEGEQQESQRADAQDAAAASAARKAAARKAAEGGGPE